MPIRGNYLLDLVLIDIADYVSASCLVLIADYLSIMVNLEMHFDVLPLIIVLYLIRRVFADKLSEVIWIILLGMGCRIRCQMKKHNLFLKNSNLVLTHSFLNVIFRSLYLLSPDLMIYVVL